MPEDLDARDVLMADPPLVEPHWQPHGHVAEATDDMELGNKHMSTAALWWAEVIGDWPV